MNKLALLMTGLVLLASSWPAQAAEIPAKYRGEWCEHYPYYAPYHRGECKRGGIGYLRVTARGYELEMEDSERCRIIRVKPDRYPDGDNGHLLTFTCDIDGAEGPQSLTSRFSTMPGKYGKGIRLYIEPLDSDQRKD